MNGTARRGLEIRRVLLVTFGLNLLVAILKIAYGTLTETRSLQADGFHSLTDGANNLLGIIGGWWSARPPDEGHPYGHERSEALVATVVGALLILVAWEVARGAIERWGDEASRPRPDAGSVAILVVTLVVNAAVTRYEAKKAKQLESTFLASDAAHTASDVLVTLGVLVALAGVWLGFIWLDTVAACVIAGFILVAGVRVSWHNVGYLMDARQVDARRLRAIACSVPGVAGADAIRTRGLPGCIRVDLQIQIACHLDVVQAHEVTHWVIDAIQREIDGVRDVVVHTEPAAPDASYPALPARMLPAGATRPS